MKLARVVIFGVLLTSTGIAAQRPEAKRFTVHVAAAKDAGGFVEPGVSDSVLDINSEIPKRKSLRIAREENSADIVLRVLGREKVTESGGVLATPAGIGVAAVPLKTGSYVLYARLEIGAYRKDLVVDFSGFGGPWKECAEQLTKRLEEWVVANGTQLESLIASK